MAKAKNPFQMSGAFGTASFYTPRGSKETIVRTKGGPSARRMKVGSEFAVVRKHQTEWAACVRFSRSVCHAMGEVYRFADFNITSGFNGLGKRVMSLDKEHPVGERHLCLTQCPEAVEGFNLNRNFPLNSVLRVSPEVIIHRETMAAEVRIGRINPEFDLYNVQNLPFYRLVASLGLVQDLHFDEAAGKRREYESGATRYNGVSVSTPTEWLSAIEVSGAIELELKFKFPPSKVNIEECTFLLSLGIEFGRMGLGRQVEPVKHACCGKVMMVR